LEAAEPADLAMEVAVESEEADFAQVEVLGLVEALDFPFQPVVPVQKAQE
jgi:hypothetical protein